MKTILFYYTPLFLFFVGFSACTGPENDEDGEALYIEHCQNCHGLYGTGAGPSPSIQGVTLTQINNAIDTNFQMQDLAILTQNERQAIADYLSKFNFRQSTKTSVTTRLRVRKSNSTIQGTLTLLDSAHRSTSIYSDDNSGNYVFDVSDLQAPFLLRFEAIDGSFMYTAGSIEFDVEISDASDFMLRACYKSDDIENSFIVNGFTCIP